MKLHRQYHYSVLIEFSLLNIHTFRFLLQKKLTLTIRIILLESFHLTDHTCRFRLQEIDLSSVRKETVPLE